jgi:hypothetical protein
VGSEQDDESFEARRGLGDRVAVDEHFEFDRYSRDVERLVQLALAGLPGWEGGKHADIVAGPWEIPAGFPVGDWSPQLQRIRKEEEKNAQARAALTARRMERRLEEIRQDALDRMQREQRARSEFEEHLRRLADELDDAVARSQPNPWLRPWDTGYESPTLIALRQATEGRAADPVDIDVVRRKMQSRLAEIRRQSPPRGAPARRPVSPAGGRKPFMQWLAEMSPQEVAALPRRSVKCVDACWRAIRQACSARAAVWRAPAMQIGDFPDNGTTACFC